MSEKDDKSNLMWETGWLGHEKAQLRRMAGLSFEQKLGWLEETQELVQAIEQGRVSPLRKKSSSSRKRTC